MMQNLLAERLHLKAHYETRDYPAWDLMVANGGAKMKASVPDQSTGEDSEGPLVMGPSRTVPPGMPIDSQGFPILSRGVDYAMAITAPPL